MQQPLQHHRATLPTHISTELAPVARATHAVSRRKHAPAAAKRTAVAAAAAAAAAAGSSVTAPDLDPKVYLDPGFDPEPFVGPLAVKHIPGTLTSQSIVQIPCCLLLAGCMFDILRMPTDCCLSFYTSKYLQAAAEPDITCNLML
jgi:hypothetical protein